MSSNYQAIEQFQAAKGLPSFFEALVCLKKLEQSGEGYYGEWASLSKELRAEFYQFMAAGRAMFAPVEE